MGHHIGLTGGIASGKSVVEGMLQALGIPVIDADAVVHALLAHDTALQDEIRDRFGESIFVKDASGAPTIDRSALGRVVFADADQRKQLEGLIHPKVRARIRQFFDAQEAAPVSVASIPLLFETGMPDMAPRPYRLDAIWVVYATEAQQYERLCTTRGMSDEAIQARLASQCPLSEKRRLADLVIDNSGPLAQTRLQVEQAVATLLR
jgi:dephospho-CoA kinase